MNIIPDGKWHSEWIEDENFGPVLFSYNISKEKLEETIAALEAFQRKLDTLERKDGWITLQVVRKDNDKSA